MKIAKLKLIYTLLVFHQVLFAVESRSDDSTDRLTFHNFSFGGVVDTYAAHDFNDPTIQERPYTTQVLHEDQLDINLAMIDVGYSDDNQRGRVAIQHGTSVEANYSAENERFWRYIQEASFGAKLGDNLWIDGGIYLAHIGFESFISSDNWTYSRSLVAEYSPYYETGIKLTYQFDQNTTGQLHFLRGWQNISNNEDPALGMQVTHMFQDNFQFTYNNFFGDVAGQRFFHDFIGKLDLTSKLNLALQFDVGSQVQDDQTVWWHGWALLGRYKLSETVALGARLERFSDPHKVVLQTLNSPSYDAVGLSANIDFEVLPRFLWRTEYRAFLGQDAVFPRTDTFSKNDSFVVTSLTYQLR